MRRHCKLKQSVRAPQTEVSYVKSLQTQFKSVYVGHRKLKSIYVRKPQTDVSLCEDTAN